MSVNEGSHLDTEAECQSCHEWCSEFVMTRNADEDLICPDCTADATPEVTP